MEQRSGGGFDVLVSCSRDEVEWAKGWLIPRLASERIIAYLDEPDHGREVSHAGETARAILNSHTILLIVTPEYVKTRWADFAVMLSKTLDPAAQRLYVKAILLSETELPVDLRTISCIDMSKPEEVESRLRQLVEGLVEMKRTKKRSRVLFVEDDQSWVRIVRAVLGDCDVEDVPTSTDAITKLENASAYDLVLVNLHLTEFNEASGQEILEFIRDHHPSLPRVLMTGHPIHGPVKTVLFEGYQISELLSKGEDNIPELRQLVRRILAPCESSTSELQERKQSMFSLLREKLDTRVDEISEDLRALESYRAKLRREGDFKEADELTNPDRDVLTKKRESSKARHAELRSRILVATTMEELDSIEAEWEDGW
ncbi:MAG: TIR domain-containing protein [Chloroflexi bacterium]|nr:TIR domain-containing protein [Chloroflexota bacterium]